MGQKRKILRTLGNFLILFSIFGFLFTFGPAVYYEAQYRIGKVAGVRFKVVEDQRPTELGKILEKYKDSPQGKPSLLSSIITGNREQVLVPKSAEFSIVIPKIGANERIVANTDPSNEQEYLPVLWYQGVAHARGSAFPGMWGNTYLFAHSADNFWNVGRYNAVFYLIKELEAGDEISIFFQGRRHNYVVYDKQIVDPERVELINANLGLGEKLTLQTCWPPGTPWKRLLVFAKPKL